MPEKQDREFKPVSKKKSLPSPYQEKGKNTGILITNLNDKRLLPRIISFLKKNEPFTINISRFFF